jgi:hypothetical protein
MILWLAAAAVWCAVGARIGRVLVRQATTVRVAITVSVITVALNTMLLLPDVAGTFDRLFGSATPRQFVVEMLWATFAGATLTISDAARPLLPKSRLRCGAWCFYLIAVSATVVGFVAGLPIGWALVVIAAFGEVFVAARHISWSVLGRGVAIYTLGVVLAAITALHVLVTGDMTSPSFMVIHNLLIALGSIWILVEVWVRSMIVLLRVRRLHAMLTERFPEVLAEDPGHKTTVLRASDHVAHVMDAIYVQSAHLSGMAAKRIEPPQDPAERARIVVRWLVDPARQAAVDTEWISPPSGMSARRWVVMLAAEFDELTRRATVKA